MNYYLVEPSSFHPEPCLVLGLCSDEPLPAFIDTLNSAQNGVIQRLSEQLQRAGDSRWQSDCENHALLLIHCAKANAFHADALRKTMRQIASLLIKQGVSAATVYLPPVADLSPNKQLEEMILALDASIYQLLDYKTDPNMAHKLKDITLICPQADTMALQRANALAGCVRTTRRLANLPSNTCTPTYLAEEARALATQYPTLQTTVLDRDDMTALGMRTLLAVAQGSHEPPKFIQMEYKGISHGAPVILVGKGITFDSGGISIKPAQGMEEMKYDMAGAATVMGIMQACAELELPLNVMGLLACAENMPGGGATRPGDIVKTMSGQTVEIVNTDAEGRLVLADALTYAKQFQPRFVIDMATLTGAIIVALGHHHNGLMTNDEALAQLLLQAASESGDHTWRMPMDEAYQKALDSPLADMVNGTFDRNAGSITAACFLSRFTKDYRWAHLDIAGTAWVPGRKNHATGRPLLLITTLLRHLADAR